MRLSPRTSSDRSSVRAWRRLATLVVAALTVVASGVLTASPAAAEITTAGGTVNAGAFTVTGGSVAPNPEPAGTHNTIATTSPRTLLDFTSFNLAAGSRLDINVTSRSDVVLIRVGSGAAQVDGFLNVTTGLAVSPSTPAIGEVPTNVGGNVWFLAPNGVAFAGSARVRTGGLLATSANLVNDDDFLDRNASLSFANGGASSVTQNALGVISGNGGHVALVADQVTQSGTIDDPADTTDVLLAGSRAFTLALGQEDSGDLAVLGFSSPPPFPGSPGGQSTSPAPVQVNGSVTGGNVYLASDSSSPNALGPYVSAGASVNAAGPAASGAGNLVVVAGGGVARDNPTSLARATQWGAPEQTILIDKALAGATQTVVAASGDLTVGAAAGLSGPQVVASTGGELSYPAGAISSFLDRWVIYAPTPDDVPDPGLDSGRTALWNGDIVSDPPSTVIGTGQTSAKRYVFDSAPDITVDPVDQSKDFDAAFTAGRPMPLTDADYGYTLHPGVPGLFTGDSEPAYTGDAALSSPGQPHDMPQRLVDGPYPITASIGSLASPLRYDFVFLEGLLTVNDTSRPVVNAHVTGTEGQDDWYVSDIGVTFRVIEDGTVPVPLQGDCAGVTVTQDHDYLAYTCTATSGAGDTTGSTGQIRRDATAPGMTITATSDGDPYAPGTWTDDDVAVVYTCDFAISGFGAMPVNETFSTSGDRGGSCRDAAGNITTQEFQVSIDKVRPTVQNVQLRRAGTGPTYTPGTWVNQPVTLTWDCVDEDGGSGVVGSGSGTATATADGTTTLRTACQDVAGNSAEVQEFAVSIDTVAPTVTLSMTLPDGSPYVAGTWSRVPVTVTFTCTDTGGSGALVLGATNELTQSGSPTYYCPDRAGNSTPVPVEVRIDGTAPVIGGVELTTEDGADYASGDWTDRDVTLSWTCTDAPGASGAVLASDSRTASETGPLQAVCSDVAGNSVNSESFQANVDREAPELAGVPGDRSVTTASTTATVAWLLPTATDDQDTSVEVACDPASPAEFPVGVTTVTCTATDHAGHVATRSFTVTVVQQVLGATFDRPVDGPVMNVAKLGRVIPVRASLTLDGAPLIGTSTVPVHLQASRISCTFSGAEDTVESYAAGASNSGNLFRWDEGAGRWTYNLDTGSLGAKAGSCYRISVFYGGSAIDGHATGGASAGSFFLQTKK